MTKRDEQEFRTTLKEAKKFLRQGRYNRAEFNLLRAMELASYLPGDNSSKRAMVLHRLAEVAVHQRRPHAADRQFCAALATIDTSDTLAYARIKRDYGEFLRRNGHTKAAYREVEEAYQLINRIEKHTPRIEAELLVTEGFSARFMLANPTQREDGVETLRIIAHALRGYKKPEYELAVLRCLIEEALPLYSFERLMYIRRACLLSSQLGNFKKGGEYLSLLGGDPPRKLYRFVVR